jgi:hypothetical protein
MNELINVAIYIAVVAFVAILLIWAVQQVVSAMGAPASLAAIGRVLIIVIATLIIIQKAVPLIQ